MKKSIIFSGLMLTAALASATTIISDCAAVGASGIPASSTTTTCPSFALPGGSVTYNTVTLVYKYDADFGLGTGTVQMSHDVLGSTLGTLFDNPIPTTISDQTRPFIGTITQPATLALVQAIAAGTSINDFWSAGTGSISKVVFDYQWQVDYSTGAPEPGTLGIFGVGLLGLGLLRKRL